MINYSQLCLSNSPDNLEYKVHPSHSTQIYKLLKETLHQNLSDIKESINKDYLNIRHEQ
jgi:hypothetical protein